MLHSVLLLSLFAATSSASAQSGVAMHSALSGAWRGALRYRDYQDSTRFVTLPTLLDGTLATDSSSVRLDFTYDDGPGKTVQSSDALVIDAAARELRWGPSNGSRPATVFVVRSYAAGDTLRLVAEADGMDDERAATLRETVTVWASGLRILKEVRFRDATTWLFRHEYTFTRR